MCGRFGRRLGLTVPEDALRLIGSRLDDTVGGALLDVYAVRLDFSGSDCRLLDGEVDAVRLLPYGEFVEMVCQRQDAVYRGILEKAGRIMLSEKNYTDLNAEAIGSWARSGWEWGRPVDHETCERARAGEWSVLLSPTIPVPKDWLGELRGKKLLGLASGGGQQMPLFAIAGADCTLLDYCPEQLDSDRMVAEREGLSLNIVRGDMTRRLPFEDASFDIIFHPVSNCYIEDVQHVWNECFRVLRPGGRLLAGLDNGMNFVFDEEGVLRHRLPYNPLKDPALLEESLKKGEGVQFSHGIEEQIGGQLKAGFVLRDLYSDIDPFGWSQKYNLPAYWVTLAEKE